MITRDASPYSAFQLENFRFSSKARYVNDVHLPRFGLPAPVREDADGTVRTLYGTATRSQMHHGDSKDFSPSNAWNDSKTAVLRQLPRQNFQSDFLRLYAAKDVVIECLRASEELELRNRHRLPVQQLKFFEVQSTNQIRKLEESVLLRDVRPVQTPPDT